MSLENGIKQTIEADSLEECKRLLHEKYGDDFNIEGRESVFKSCGLFGLRQKEVQRVTYTVNHKNAYEGNSYNAEKERLLEQEQLERNKQAIIQQQASIKLNSTLSTLANQMVEINSKISTMNANKSGPEQHQTIKQIEEILEQNEFTMSYIRMIEDKIREHFSLADLDDYNLVERHVVDWIGESIQIAPEKVFRPPHVVVIIGPTGVGKTTTLSKLAAQTILNAKKQNLKRPQLCIFTIDSMRVGALEQLSKISEAMKEKVIKAAQTPDDVKEIYEQYRDHVDYIFVDTGGYSPNDSTHIGKMQNVLDVNMNPDVYLCVTASTKASDLQIIFRNYEPLGYESIIVTKCDETRQIGNIISVLYDKHKSVSYITDGQNIARNISKASVVDMLMRLNGFNIDRDHIENKFGEN
ncbi:MAG: hypothetical protein IK102_07045 [Treponema sp.]|nr:hypothetical protein [Treponema sp.]